MTLPSPAYKPCCWLILCSSQTVGSSRQLVSTIDGTATASSRLSRLCQSSSRVQLSPISLVQRPHAVATIASSPALETHPTTLALCAFECVRVQLLREPSLPQYPSVSPD